MADGGENENEVLDLPVTEGEVIDDVEIELSDDDLDGIDVEEKHEEDQPQDEKPVAEEEQQEEEKPKRKRSSENRIAELARRAQEAERRAQEAEARIAQETEARRQSDLAMMTHYEQNLQGQANFVKQQLQEAISIGDTAQQVELQSKLFQIQSEISGVDSWKQQFEVSRPHAEPVKQQPTQQPKVTLEPKTQAWISDNTWFQPNSPDFDPEMHEEATLYARRIERRFKAEGRAADIGGDDYFAEIDRHIREEFADAFEDHAPAKKSPPMGRDNSVAPVVRTGTPGQAVKQSKSIRLTADQRQLARQLADSGAIKKAGGGRMTQAEAEKHYAIFLMKQNRR